MNLKMFMVIYIILFGGGTAAWMIIDSMRRGHPLWFYIHPVLVLIVTVLFLLNCP
jgi:hypothetical protein